MYSKLFNHRPYSQKEAAVVNYARKYYAKHLSLILEFPSIAFQQALLVKVNWLIAWFFDLKLDLADAHLIEKWMKVPLCLECLCYSC